jgi:hypothetical protein
VTAVAPQAGQTSLSVYLLQLWHLRSVVFMHLHRSTQ